MKILIVSQYYYPEQFQINEIAPELVKRGHQVTVLTELPNYPGGEIYAGYEEKGRRSEEINGVHVIRVKDLPRKTGAFICSQVCLRASETMISARSPSECP